MNLAPAWKAAFAALLAVDRGAWSAEALAAKSVHLDPRDAGLASDIVFGVLRRRGELDDVIRQYSKVPLDRLDPEVWIALEMAFYQMRFLDRVPSHAAVNDAVELARRLAMASAASFVNAISGGTATAARGSGGNAFHAGVVAGSVDHSLWPRDGARDRSGKSENSER